MLVSFIGKLSVKLIYWRFLIIKRLILFGHNISVTKIKIFRNIFLFKQLGMMIFNGGGFILGLL
jgi:hypothetical protein